jgi:hypothetical protein
MNFGFNNKNSLVLPLYSQVHMLVPPCKSGRYVVYVYFINCATNVTCI